MRRLAVCAFFLLGGLTAAQTSTIPELRTAAATITADHLLRHIRELSSDAYTGRFPGTPGEDRSVAYVVSQIKAIGLQRGTPTGGFTQKVPLYGIRTHGTITVTAGGKRFRCLRRRTSFCGRICRTTRPMSEVPSWYLPATGLSHPNTTGTTTPAWTSPARRSWSSLAIRQSPTRRSHEARRTCLPGQGPDHLRPNGHQARDRIHAWSRRSPPGSARARRLATCGRTSRAKT